MFAALTETIVIFALIFAVIVLYLRSGKKKHALCSLPLLALPAANILSYFFLDRLAGYLPYEKFTVYSAIIVVGALISSGLSGVWSNKFSKRPSKGLYMIMSFVFNAVFAGILISGMYEQIFGS